MGNNQEENLCKFCARKNSCAKVVQTQSRPPICAKSVQRFWLDDAMPARHKDSFEPTAGHAVYGTARPVRERTSAGHLYGLNFFMSLFGVQSGGTAVWACLWRGRGFDGGAKAGHDGH
jgi:hypothetical protein